MADKNNTSSLLEAIKNKLSKFENKPKPENKSSVNYFSQDLKNSAIDGAFVDKTNIELIFDAEKKLNDSTKANYKIEQKAKNNYQKEVDLDIDDESLNVKNLGQKILIESRIKEIADELNLEEFEDDFEDEKDSEIEEENTKEDGDEINKNLDPIDVELMELEKEVNKNNQQKLKNISDEKVDKEIEDDADLKNYLDSKFEDEFNEIEEKIQNENKILDSHEDSPKEASSPSSYQEEPEKEQALIDSTFLESESHRFLNITPAQDFLASMQSTIPEQKIEEMVKISENYPTKESFESVAVVEENLEQKTISNQDFLASTQSAIPEQKVEEMVQISENYPTKESFESVAIVEEINKTNKEEDLQKSKINEEILFAKNIRNYETDNSQNLELNIENNSVNNVVLEKINYNLIREETFYQASNSMKKLMEAKNLVNSVGKFSQDETLTKIAMNLMEPKLEKWLNDNLPSLVENIVREEIEKIVPKI